MTEFILFQKNNCLFLFKIKIEKMIFKKTFLRKTGMYSFLVLTFLACKKKEAEDPVVTCIAGIGGSTTLIVDLKHHSLLIPSDSLHPDTVWIKYNAVDAGLGYDVQKIGIPGDSTITFNGLKCGNYFLTASGYDNSISMPVNGGLGITIAESSDTVMVTIPVVE